MIVLVLNISTVKNLRWIYASVLVHHIVTSNNDVNDAKVMLVRGIVV